MTDPAQTDPWLLEPQSQQNTPESSGPAQPGQESSHSIGADGGPADIGSTALLQVSDQLAQLKALFEARIIEGEQQQQWVAQLISQLADYRNDFVYSNITGRIFRDLIQIYDTFGQTLDAAAHEGITKEDVIARLQNLHRQVLRIFDRQGVEQIRSDYRTRFDEAEQEAIDVRPVDRPEDDGIVLESARCGFRYGTRLLRPESVIVGRYEPKGWEADD